MRVKDTPTTKEVEANQRYFLLHDDALSVNGAHPREGDICSARKGEGREGAMHLVRLESGHTVAGHLYHRGKTIVLKFDNPQYKDWMRPASAIESIFLVEQFFNAQEPITQETFAHVRSPAGTSRARRRRAPVVNLAAWKESRAHMN